jgi:DNA processing protein
LRQIDAPPPVLFVKGELHETDRRAVAVVGTRRPSPYGKDVARALARELAQQQIAVVSGLARGIDAIAHRAALDAGGRTIAVLGSGVDQIYPAEHRELAQAIRAAGAVVSDYLPGTPPDAVNFPPRNRIISGLSLGTIVVESGETSGALITARFALEQGREVFAVPGNIYARTSIGPNRLIQQGAKLVCGLEDVLEELHLHARPPQVEPVQVTLWPDPAERRILDALAVGPVHADELGRQTGLTASQVSSALVVLELQGRVRHLGAMQYVAA